MVNSYACFPKDITICLAPQYLSCIWSDFVRRTDGTGAAASKVSLVLDWLEANPETDRGRVQGPNLQNNQIDLRLLCASCNNQTNPCFYRGTCTAGGNCVCEQGGKESAGTLCQIPPSGNGFCDVNFNTPQFNFDGGDCVSGLACLCYTIRVLSPISNCSCSPPVRRDVREYGGKGVWSCRAKHYLRQHVGLPWIPELYRSRCSEASFRIADAVQHSRKGRSHLRNLQIRYPD